MEKWDLFDKNGQHLNKTITRGERMGEDEYHIAVYVIVINSKKEVLLTLRHPSKKYSPNKWEFTGGSVLAGETSRTGTIRELKEETGISVLENELVFLDNYKDEDIIKGENRLVDVYMVKKDIEISSLKMQEGETVDAKWVTLQAFDEMVKEESVTKNILKYLKYYIHDILK